eukprot:COSAG02_NODE_15593_length_1157_cov_1.946125_2_plen_230_part_01
MTDLSARDRQTCLRVFRALVRESGVHARRLAWEHYEAQSRQALPPPPDQMDETVHNQWHEERRQEQPAWMASWSSVEQRLQQVRPRDVPAAPTALTEHTQATDQAAQPSRDEPTVESERAEKADATEKQRQDKEALLKRAREVEAVLKEAERAREFEEAEAAVRDQELRVSLQTHTAAPPPSGCPNVIGVWKAEGVLADEVSTVVEYFELVPHADGNIVGAGYEATADAQ